MHRWILWRSNGLDQLKSPYQIQLENSYFRILKKLGHDQRVHAEYDNMDMDSISKIAKFKIKYIRKLAVHQRVLIEYN